MRHLRLTVPAIYSSNPETRFHRVIEILDQVCEQYKKQIPTLAWKPLSITSRELKNIFGEVTPKNKLRMTHRGDISVIHADKKHTFGKRYMLQISSDGSNVSLAVAGSRELYDLLVDMNQDRNLLLSQKSLRRPVSCKKKIVIELLQLITTPSGGNDSDSFMYSVLYKQPPRTVPDRAFKTMQRQLQQLTLTPELYVNSDGGHTHNITDLEFAKIFGVKLLRRLSMSDDTISDLKHIHSAYRRLWPFINGHIAYSEGIKKNGSLQAVSQKSLLYTIIEQTKKNNRLLPRVVIVRVSELIGYGLVAGEHIPAGTIIGEYCGEISRVSATNSYDNTYFTAYAPDQVPGSELFVVDARKGGNPTRFINHSDENANATWANVFDGKNFRPIIAAVKTIPKGKQILLKYKDSYWTSRQRGEPSPLSDIPYPL